MCLFFFLSKWRHDCCNFLAEPHAGFRIAFNMFDTDGNEMVDKKEFLVVCIFSIFQCFYVILKFAFCLDWDLRWCQRSWEREAFSTDWSGLFALFNVNSKCNVNSSFLLQYMYTLCIMVFEASSFYSGSL